MEPADEPSPSTSAAVPERPPPRARRPQGTSRKPRTHLISFWAAPVDTFRQVLEEASPRGVFLLAALSAWGFVVPGTLSPGRAASDMVVTTIELTLLTVAAVGLLFLRGMIVGHIGQWLGGVGTTATARLAVAWSSLPLAALSRLHLPLLFSPKGDLPETAVIVWFFALLAALVWAFWSEVNLVAVAHELGRARSAAIVLLGATLPVLGLIGASWAVLG